MSYKDEAVTADEREKLTKIGLVEHGVATGYPWIKGRCPACRWASLFVGAGGFLTCGNLRCPDPMAAGNLLERPTQENQ